jgi:hypothetical protein
MTNKQWLKEQCNRYVNGFCGTRSCLVRGKALKKLPIDLNKATCHAHEILQKLSKKKNL